MNQATEFSSCTRPIVLFDAYPTCNESRQTHRLVFSQVPLMLDVTDNTLTTQVDEWLWDFEQARKSADIAVLSSLFYAPMVRAVRCDRGTS